MNRRATAISFLLPLLLLASCGPSVPPPPITGSGNSLSLPADAQGLEREAATNPEAAFKLGAMYHDGDGVSKDVERALYWFDVAARAGERKAQFNLGLMYLQGDGVDEDIALARRWFQRSADQGNERAHFQLGMMYYTGTGVKQDFAQASEHFTSAGLSGVAEAQYNLGVMAVRAEGGPQDLPEAWAWFSLAVQYGSEKAAASLATIDKALSAEQKTKAESRLTELKAKVGSVVQFGS